MNETAIEIGEEESAVDDLLEAFYLLTGLSDSDMAIEQHETSSVHTYLLIDSVIGYFEIIMKVSDDTDEMGRPSMSISPVEHTWRLLRRGKEELQIFNPNRWATKQAAEADLEYYLQQSGDEPSYWTVQAVLGEGDNLDGESVRT